MCIFPKAVFAIEVDASVVEEDETVLLFCSVRWCLGLIRNLVYALAGNLRASSPEVRLVLLCQ